MKKVLASTAGLVSVFAVAACSQAEPFYETYEPSDSPAPVASETADNEDTESIEDGAGSESNDTEEPSAPAVEASEDTDDDNASSGFSFDDVDVDEIVDDIFGGDIESPDNAGGADQWAEYDRSEFPHWNDIDGSGCDARNETLARDLTTFETENDCLVTEGVLDDQFSGEIIYYEQGGDYENSIDIDHIVPLEYAATHGGAMGWSEAEREQFANDPANLIAVSPSQNRSKGSAGPGEWMPDNESFHCEYVTTFADIANTYGITLTDADVAKLEEVC